MTFRYWVGFTLQDLYRTTQSHPFKLPIWLLPITMSLVVGFCYGIQEAGP